MDFNSIIGQNKVIDSLKESLKSGKIGHAYVFSGSMGIGKRTVARIFGSMLLCEYGNEGSSCGKCMPCQLHDNGTNPDFLEIDPEGGSIGVDEVRKIQRDVGIRPMYSKRKVYLIIDAQRMTQQAQNSLLKTLEEPPPFAVIILTTSNFGALLETIRSRTVRYDFKKNSIEEIKSVLTARCGTDPKGLDFIASYSGGIIGAALELASSEKFSVLRERTIEIADKLKKSKLVDIFDIYSYFEENKDDIDRILDIMLIYYRDLLAFKNTGEENVLINYDKKDIILENVSHYSRLELSRNVDIIEVTRRSIKQNANYQLAIEVMLIKLQEEQI